MLDGVDPQALREQETVRERVKIGFDAIKAQLDTMLETRPSRMIRLEDDDIPTPASAPVQAALLPEMVDIAEPDDIPF